MVTKVVPKGVSRVPINFCVRNDKTSVLTSPRARGRSRSSGACSCAVVVPPVGAQRRRPWACREGGVRHPAHKRATVQMVANRCTGFSIVRDENVGPWAHTAGRFVEARAMKQFAPAQMRMVTKRRLLVGFLQAARLCAHTHEHPGGLLSQGEAMAGQFGAADMCSKR